ncbi:hypothetical protein F5Y16DRAFT_240792 [Xylariaceae sp. FL0255]|nr:hypothetical protein F5Y16DRAFT_240792 [Xylariaceae sp. FL0255]
MACKYNIEQTLRTDNIPKKKSGWYVPRVVDRATDQLSHLHVSPGPCPHTLTSLQLGALIDVYKVYADLTTFSLGGAYITERAATVPINRTMTTYILCDRCCARRAPGISRLTDKSNVILNCKPRRGVQGHQEEAIRIAKIMVCKGDDEESFLHALHPQLVGPSSRPVMHGMLLHAPHLALAGIYPNGPLCRVIKPDPRAKST